MRRAVILFTAAALFALPATVGAQLGLQRGLLVPDIQGAIDRLTGTLNLDQIQRLSPMEAGQQLLRARTERLVAFVRRNSDSVALDDQNQPAVKATILLTGASDADISTLESAGYRVTSGSIDGLDLSYAQLIVPENENLAHAIRRVRTLAPNAQVSSDPIHFQTASGQPLAASASASATQTVAIQSGNGAPPKTIGLIDGGIAANPSLQAPIMQRGFATGAPMPSAHGTAIASLLSGMGPIRGAAPGTPLLAADIYGRDPAGGSALAIARALGWMTASHVSVVTISLVGPQNPLLGQAIAIAQKRGVSIVAAVGNDGPAAPPAFPASYSGVIAVTGVDGRNHVLIEAGRALHLDYAAPGADMGAADANGKTARVRGTSFAAPLVAGRLYSHRRNGSIDAALRALSAEARDLGPKGPDREYGHGLLCGDCRNPV